MESLLSLLRMHWDHEPLPCKNIEPPTSNTERRTFSDRSSGEFGVGCWMLNVRCSRFMESLYGLFPAHWNHEPFPCKNIEPPTSNTEHRTKVDGSPEEFESWKLNVRCSMFAVHGKGRSEGIL